MSPLLDSAPQDRVERWGWAATARPRTDTYTERYLDAAAALGYRLVEEAMRAEPAALPAGVAAIVTQLERLEEAYALRESLMREEDSPPK